MFAAALHDSLVDRNLTDIVDIVFVSDHGMTDTSHPTLIYVDDEDMLGEHGLSAVVHEDGWPSMGLRFNSKQNESRYLEKLLNSQHPHAEGFDVYTKETMPSQWHFAYHDRIAPVWIIPKIGYALTTRKEGDVGMSKGVRDSWYLVAAATDFFLNLSRIMAMITTNHLCMQCSLPMGHSLPSSRIYTRPPSVPGYLGKIKAGIPHPRIPMSWIHFRM